MPLTSQSSLICEMGTTFQVASVSTRLGDSEGCLPNTCALHSGVAWSNSHSRAKTHRGVRT